MSTLCRTLGMVAVAAFIFGSCDDDGSSNFSSGVDKNKQIGQLTAAELQEVCGGAAEFIAKEDAFDELICKATSIGALVSGGTQACNAAYQECLSGDGGISQVDGGADGGVGAGCNVPANCTATVGEYEQCINDGRRIVVDLNKSIKACDLNSLTNVDAGAVQEGPASCQTLESKCPGITDELPSAGEL